MVVCIPCMANTDTKINKVYLNVITTLAMCCGEPLAQAQTGPALRWISAAKKTSAGPVTWAHAHLLDRQVRDVHSVLHGAADDLELSDIPVA
jgi:hypothetical protein